jgi:signal transduction histidine kinase
MPTTALILPAEIDLEKFISVQAHDLRTPFNHITGFTKMILNHLGDAPLTDFQKEDLGTVYKSGLRALMLMNGLIDAARLNRRELKSSPAETAIKTVVDDGLAQWKKFHPAGEVQIETRFLALTPALNADEQMLRQIISECVAYVGIFTEGKAAVTKIGRAHV